MQLSKVLSLVTAVTAAMAFAAVPAHADDDLPPADPVAAPVEPPVVLHHIKYTVGASQPVRASIYYREVDPPSFADYSHNPYEFTPKAEADLGPGKSWVFETNLADPEAWAMVVASIPEFHPGLEAPGFVCELRVDGEVRATNSGLKGALCSLRPW